MTKMAVDGKPVIDNDRFRVLERDGEYFGMEKPHQAYTNDGRIFIQDISREPRDSMGKGLDAINAKDVIKKGDVVALKVNLGGGIHGVLPTYTDPELVEGVVTWIRAAGARPFICEANMRGHEITQGLLKVRGYFPLLTEMKVPFVNLSRTKAVRFYCSGLQLPVDMPLLLLRENVKVISFAPPKHHWECGITCAQKNMYGAIANYKKSRFHRTYELIDRVVAAASRIMKPRLCIIATKQLGAGLGPHFAIPFDFHRAIFARDMLSCDEYCATLLGYPARRITYHEINRQGNDIKVEVLPGSALPDADTVSKVQKNYIPPKTVELYKRTLFIQYFVPSWLQIKTYHHFEWLLTWLNRKFYAPRGDHPHRGNNNDL